MVLRKPLLILIHTCYLSQMSPIPILSELNCRPLKKLRARFRVNGGEMGFASEVLAGATSNLVGEI